jgi:haloalkane dehalogenase
MQRATVLVWMTFFGCSESSSPSVDANLTPTTRDVAVLDSTMHVVESGVGEPIVFVHGNPVSSFLWRNVTPPLAPRFRCIAPDLIGMGKSGKPLIEYTFADQERYFATLLDTILPPTAEVILVVHDWGGAVGLSWARNHPERVRGVVFGDIFIRTYATYDELGAFGSQYQIFRSQQGTDLILNGNIMIEQLLPGAIARTLTPEEMAEYRAPYPTPASRKPLQRWFQGWPVAGEPQDAITAVAANFEWLRGSTIPKLLIEPMHEAGGFEMISDSDIARLSETMTKLSVVRLGAAKHFVQEDLPAEYAAAIAEWTRANGW